MLDFKKYENRLEKPTERMSPRFYVNQVICSKKNIEDFRERLDKLEAEIDAYERDVQGFDAAQAAYNAEDARIIKEFWHDAFEELGIPDPPASEKPYVEAIIDDSLNQAETNDWEDVFYSLRAVWETYNRYRSF